MPKKPRRESQRPDPAGPVDSTTLTEYIVNQYGYLGDVDRAIHEVQRTLKERLYALRAAGDTLIRARVERALAEIEAGNAGEDALTASELSSLLERYA